MSLVPDTQSSHTSQDTEILLVRQQIQALIRRRATLTAAFLSSPSSQVLLTRAKADPASSKHAEALEKRINEQQRQDVQNTYRMCAGATMFEARDPDPTAVDEGRISGIRIEVFDQRSKTFRTPYYVLLHRPHATSRSLRIHRHTIPPCIPLQSLAMRFLPLAPLAGGKAPKAQNLGRFVRDLRRELVSYHRRQDTLANLGDSASTNVKEIKAVDAEIRDIQIEWDHGTIGRVAIGNSGGIEKVVVLDDNGRRTRNAERKILEAGSILQLLDVL
ncbi:hypothetical protein MMC13_002140 [Lambiella insularis]|nr:hypothetical protein [Lambiella insularis]